MRSRMGLQKPELQEMLLNHQTSHSQVTKPRDCIKPQRSRQAPKSKRGSEQSWQTSSIFAYNFHGKGKWMHSKTQTTSVFGSVVTVTFSNSFSCRKVCK
ncbi:hypothetical protein NC653_024985 [Populus alba x Populus x berolinensis]|uniref:Uncharacterized protein n=1 Tax=Populus alba x Populus x berolinensis TaxID=444605 RepID=A0AAD6MA68_9ROSI|nr:hypothetical protein NC653_024985 [Populus alba x Populus x berolinensis]